MRERFDHVRQDEQHPVEIARRFPPARARREREPERPAKAHLEGAYVSDEAARQQQIAWNAPPEMVEARLSIFRAIREGRLAAMTGTVEQVLRRKAIRFRTWVEQNAAAFR